MLHYVITQMVYYLSLLPGGLNKFLSKPVILVSAIIRLSTRVLRFVLLCLAFAVTGTTLHWEKLAPTGDLPSGREGHGML